MGNSFKKAVIFAAGAALGSAVSWYFTKAKYEQILDEEIASVKDVYSKKYFEEGPSDSEETIDESNDEEIVEILDNDEKIAEYVTSKSERKSVTEYVQSLGYTEPDTGIQKRNIFDSSSSVDSPYTIEPDEFGALDGYEDIYLTYYADGFLCDDRDELIDDVEDVVGWESLDCFGEYEDDIVHVRNDRLQADYEITRDLRNYKDVVEQEE